MRWIAIRKRQPCEKSSGCPSRPAVQPVPRRNPPRSCNSTARTIPSSEKNDRLRARFRHGTTRRDPLTTEATMLKRPNANRLVRHSQSRARENYIIDALERRRMLADTFTATAGNDTIDIADTGSLTRITINGTVHNSTATEINVNAGGGDDAFRVQSTRSGVLLRLNGQEGNDITTNNGVLDLDAVYRGPTFFFGGAGRDTYLANNANDAT